MINDDNYDENVSHSILSFYLFVFLCQAINLSMRILCSYASVAVLSMSSDFSSSLLASFSLTSTFTIAESCFELVLPFSILFETSYLTFEKKQNYRIVIVFLMLRLEAILELPANFCICERYAFSCNWQPFGLS